MRLDTPAEGASFPRLWAARDKQAGLARTSLFPLGARLLSLLCLLGSTASSPVLPSIPLPLLPLTTPALDSRGIWFS